MNILTKRVSNIANTPRSLQLAMKFMF